VPNHCSNSLSATGPDAPAFFAAVDAAPDHDFIEALIPMPAALREIQTGGCTIDGERVTEWTTDADGKNHKITELDRQHIMDLHGTCDWYEWARTHYGTKWGCYSVDFNKDAILFDSAWSPPIPAIETISEMYPNATFTLAYAEGGSCYWGTTVIQNGAIIDTDESDEFWDDMAEETGDAMDSLMPACREHIEAYALHTGG